MDTINLCDYPWIAVAGCDNRKSLFQLFSEPDLKHLAGTPVDKIVVLRLLLCIVHASNEIPDDDAWLTLGTEKMAANALEYLNANYDSFFLSGEHPFLQFPQLAALGGTADPLGGLLVNVAEGNKVVLSDWNRYHPLDKAEKIYLLLRSACYACGGKKYDKTLVIDKQTVKGATGRAGTLLGFKGFLHAYLLGETLRETLRLNLLTEQEIGQLKAFPSGIGRPFWEQMPAGENDASAIHYRESYLGQLFPIDKFLLLKDEGIVKTDGIAYPSHKDGLVDPALTLFKDGKELRALWADTEKRPWRELPALLCFLEGNEAGPPYFISLGLRKTRQLHRNAVTVWTGGMAVSANSGEQYLSGKNDYVESQFSFPSDYLDANGFNRFKQMMEDVDKQGKRLYACVASYFKEVSDKIQGSTKGGPLCGSVASAATTAFWEQMEARAQPIANLAFSDSPEELLDNERRQWFRLLCKVFDTFCPHGTPRQLAAWVMTNPAFQTKRNSKEVK